ncbi:MAG: flagellar hook-associated protein FlgK [Phycisphaeraceae bacterium]|nr:flagellar hook-associated protein FlgK [Phycisphaeraceae bacterium]
MSLSAAMQIGRTALSASQLGIATTGNNMANAATPGYRRQLATLTPSKGAGRGLAGSVGLGVAVADIRRQVSISLENRTRGALSDEHASYARQNILGAIETALGELGDNDLSSQLSSFFNAWSERANLVQSSAVVVQEGRSLSSFIQRLRGELTSQRTQLDQELGQASLRASDLIDRIAGLNTAIAQSEVASTTANSLRDQRDALIEELATMVDVSVIERGGSTDILIGSTPVVLDGISRGLTMQRSANGEIRLATRDDGTLLSPKSGAIGSLLAERTGAVDRSINALDSLASNLIHEVNKLHSTSIGDAWLQSSAASLRIPVADRSLALNDPANATLRSLPFAPTNGGFNVNIRNTATGAITTVRVGVDLDGLTAAATPGTSNDTSAEDIRSALHAIPGLNAAFTPDGSLSIAANAGFEYSFSDDTSGVLAVLGINAYFTGTNASDIDISSTLDANPGMLGVGTWGPGGLVENGAALALAGLNAKQIPALGGRTLLAAWRDHVTVTASAASAAQTEAAAATVVRESLDSQRAAVSGVSLDEEAINLLNFQQQYQAGARVIEVARQLMESLLSIV